jgi:hypothetical protein
MTIKIVVARYNEDIEWINQFQSISVIYNKGNKLETPLICNEVLLDNVGREGHTYYKYICDNYDNLEKYTIFLQGNPFDHSPNIISNLNKYIHDTQLNNDFEFEFLSEKIFDCNLSGCHYHYDLPLIDVYETLFMERKKDMDFQFGAGGQFIVSKSLILNKPKEFYQKIVDMLQNDNHPIEGFVIERFHKIIFTTPVQN